MVQGQNFRRDLTSKEYRITTKNEPGLREKESKIIMIRGEIERGGRAAVMVKKIGLGRVGVER